MDTIDNFKDSGTRWPVYNSDSCPMLLSETCVEAQDMAPPKAKKKRNDKYPKKPRLNLIKKTTGMIKKKDLSSRNKFLKKKRQLTTTKSLIQLGKHEKSKILSVRSCVPRKVVPTKEVPNEPVPNWLEKIAKDEICKAPGLLQDFMTKLIHSPNPAGQEESMPKPVKPVLPVKKNLMPQPVLPIDKQFLSPEGLQNNFNIGLNPESNSDLDLNTYALRSVWHSPAESRQLKMPDKPNPEKEPKDFSHNDQFPKNFEPPRTSRDIESSRVSLKSKCKTRKPKLMTTRRLMKERKPKLNLRKKPPIRKKPKTDRFWLSRWIWPSRTSLKSLK